MSIRMKVFVLTIFLWCHLGFSQSVKARSEAPVAVDGVINVVGWDLSRHGPVSLAGTWKLSPWENSLEASQVISVPGGWHDADKAYEWAVYTLDIRGLIGSSKLVIHNVRSNLKAEIIDIDGDRTDNYLP